LQDQRELKLQEHTSWSYPLYLLIYIKIIDSYPVLSEGK